MVGKSPLDANDADFIDAKEEADDEATSDEASRTGIDGIVEKAVRDNKEEDAADEPRETDDDKLIEIHANGYREPDDRTDTDSDSSADRAGTQDGAVTSDRTGTSDILAPEAVTHPTQKMIEENESPQRESAPAEDIKVLDDAELVGVDTEPTSPDDDTEFETELEDFEFQRESEQSGPRDEIPARGDAVFISEGDRDASATSSSEQSEQSQDTDGDSDDDDEFLVGS